MPLALGAAQVGIAAYGAYRSHRQASEQRQKEDAANKAQQGISSDFMGRGRALLDQGGEALQRSGQYFTRLASGDRGTMAQELAPDVQNVNDVYGGARRSLSRFLRGPEKDMQLGELERERAGGVARIFRDARPNAVARLLDFGSSTTGMGGGFLERAAGIQGGLGRQFTQNRFRAEDQEHESGQEFGSVLADLLRQYAQRSGSNSRSLGWGYQGNR